MKVSFKPARVGTLRLKIRAVPLVNGGVRVGSILLLRSNKSLPKRVGCCIPAMGLVAAPPLSCLEGRGNLKGLRCIVDVPK